MGPPGRRLRIAQVAPLWTPIPPRAYYGGTEVIVHLLTEGLVRLGHRVTLFASGDSQTGASLRPVIRENVIDAMARGEASAYEHYASAAMADALRMADSFDVIHCHHLDCSRIPFGAMSRVPVVYTVHNPLLADDRWILHRFSDTPVVCVSHAQASAVSAGHRSLRVIHHGIDVGAYAASTSPGTYLVFLGRMGPHKGPVEAIRIARAAGMPLVLAGRAQDASEEAYFAGHVRPHIDGRTIRWVGPVDHAQKNALLAGAAALLYPIQWQESFGLVMIEAMACGTPVIACNKGAVPEIIEFGRTGFYADAVEELAAMVPAAMRLDRAAVRQEAMTRFSHERMVREYVEVYRSLVCDAASGDPASTTS